MDISKAAVGFIAVTCLVAGATGAFMATRSASRTTEPVQSAPTQAPTQTVEQSEGLVARAPQPLPLPSRVAPPARPVAPAARPVVTPPPIQPERPAAPDTFQPAPAPIEAPAAPASAEPARVSETVPAAAAAPEPAFEDLELPAQSVIGLQLESSVSSETARIEDEVIAHVTRDVRIGDRVAIPAGTKAHGEVTMVERGARVRDRGRLGVRFTSLVLGDGTRVPIDSQPIFREGDSVRNENAAKIGGGAIGGLIIGGIIGGAKGAAIGGSIGAGAGTAAVVAAGRNAATLSSGSPVTVRLERPVVVTVER
jgi:hypothetical protein